MDNTSNYLQKQVAEIESLIENAKEIMVGELGVNLYQESEYQNQFENQMIEKEIREVEEEEFEEDEEEEDFDD